MMHRPELDLIASYLRPADVYLEFGAGASTLNFAPLVRAAYSVEHDCRWADHVRDRVARRRAYAGLELRCVNVPPGFRAWGTVSAFEHGSYRQFREYVDSVAAFPHTVFDKVLIDGRARVACALKVLPHLHDHSLVFVHDFYARAHLYAALLPYYVEVARVRAVRNADPRAGPVDEPQGLLVLRRNASASWPVPDAAVHAVYAGDAWREPFPAPLVSVSAYLRYYFGLATDLAQWRRARSPDMLVALVRHDLLRLALLYGVVMFLARNWRLLAGRKAAAAPPARAPAARGLDAGAGDDVSVVVREGAAEASRRNVAGDGVAVASVAKSQSAVRHGEVELGRPAAKVKVKGRGKAASEPRFVETEAMKAANARRKARQQSFAKAS